MLCYLRAGKLIDRWRLDPTLRVEGAEPVGPKRVNHEHDDVLRRLELCLLAHGNQDSGRAPSQPPFSLPLGSKVDPHRLTGEGAQVNIVFGP